MKISRFLSITAFITFFSLIYVWQQTEVFRLAYVGQKNQATFQDLLDKNSILRYNLKQNVSLICIGNKVSESADYEMPDNYRLVRSLAPNKEIRAVKQTSQKENILSRLLGIKRQAEARTVNP